MAKCEIKMPDEFLTKLSTLDDKTDEIIIEVLGAGGKVVLEAVEKNLTSVIGRSTKKESRSTGQLLKSLGLTSAKQDKDLVWNVKIGFQKGLRALRPEDSGLRKKIRYSSSIRRQRSAEERRLHNNSQAHAMTNHDVAYFLEHGRHNQPAKPFLKPAKTQSKRACIDAMKSKFESEVGSI